MFKPTKDKAYPIRHYVKIMFLVSFLALVLDFVISLAAISIVKQQSTRSLQDTADLYIHRINHDFAYMTHYMGWTLANDESLETMNANPVNSYAFIKANENLHKQYSELQKNYGKEYQFFVYLKKPGFFLNCAPLNIGYSDYQALKKQVMSYVEEKNIYERFYSQWTPIEVGGKHYVTNIVPYHDSYMISLVSADDLIRPLRGINLGENGYVSLVSGEGRGLTSPVSNNGERIAAESGRTLLPDLFRTRTTVHGEFNNASFYVKLVIQFGAFERIMVAQLLIILLAVIITCNVCFIMLYFKNKVLKPIKSFSYNLAFWTEDGDPLDIGSSKIIELEKASKQFMHLVGQIRKFKIDLYERELEKQRIQLDYMKLQIKPHFFLNCLTSIYSMAQMQMHQEIESMALSTSKYFRYIFQSGENFVGLEEELDHVRTYLDIQKHRYRDALSYSIQREGEDTRNARIPPLVLQTFVENAVKYAVSRTSEAVIELAVRREADGDAERLVFRIADTGPGYPSEILEALQQGRPLDQSGGTHIGIMNTLRRLEFLYRNEAKVLFANREHGGACVTLYLPVVVPEKTGG
ncbi:histidine kinase [Paenibacillus sp. alder61]|nr:MULTISPECIES: sensor histidine kinase [Paenibacillus]MCA1292431.1 histidine kinase [Paenibacillus sp. alder61]